MSMIPLTLDFPVSDLPYRVKIPGDYDPTDLVVCYSVDNPEIEVQFQANFIQNGVNL